MTTDVAASPRGKRFLSPLELFRDAFALGRQVFDSGFRPDLLLAVWRGGTPVGAAVHEALEYLGVHTDHTVVKAASYAGIGERTAPVLELMASVLDRIHAGTSVLVVDDIYDTGSTIEEIRRTLSARTRDIRVATLYCRPPGGRGGGRPDFVVRELDEWIVFPHELAGLSEAEILEEDPFVHRLLFPPRMGEEERDPGPAAPVGSA